MERPSLEFWKVKASSGRKENQSEGSGLGEGGLLDGSGREGRQLEVPEEQLQRAGI